MNQITPAYIINHIARMEDLPYQYCPVQEYILTQSAPLVAGQYAFTAGRAEMTGSKNLNRGTILYIKSFSFDADISAANFQEAIKLTGNVVNIPNFNMFFKSEQNTPTLRDPLRLPKFFDEQEYRKVIFLDKTPNKVNGFFRGTLQQHAGIAGVTAINLTITMFAQEINDQNFALALKKGYPRDRSI